MRTPGRDVFHACSVYCIARNAPCEPVCPYMRLVHSAEGLNDMVYNRCVGTRVLFNKLSIQSRRFNFLLYQDWNTPTYKLMRNPEVSVRHAVWMEKCTYCVQRYQKRQDRSRAGYSGRWQTAQGTRWRDRHGLPQAVCSGGGDRLR